MANQELGAVNGKDYWRAVIDIAWAASGEESRPQLNGMHLMFRRGWLRLTAMDGHVVASRRIRVEGGPRRAEFQTVSRGLPFARAVKGMKECRLAVESHEKRGVFVHPAKDVIQCDKSLAAGGTFEKVLLLDQNRVKWWQVVRPHTSPRPTVEVDRKALLDAMRPHAKRRFPTPVRFTAGDGRIRWRTSESKESCWEDGRIEGEWCGLNAPGDDWGGRTVLVNPKLVVKALGSFRGPSVCVSARLTARYVKSMVVSQDRGEGVMICSMADK